MSFFGEPKPDTPHYSPTYEAVHGEVITFTDSASTITVTHNVGHTNYFVGTTLHATGNSIKVGNKTATSCDITIGSAPALGATIDADVFVVKLV